MVEENQNKENENYSEFMENYVPDIIEQQLNIGTDDNSKKEEIRLFSGNLNNIDTWLKHEEFRLKKENQDSERGLREKNAKYAFWFALCWAIFILVFVLLYGFREYTNFKMTEYEFMFVCGTLTTSILTFYLVVIKNLFPNKNI